MVSLHRWLQQEAASASAVNARASIAAPQSGRPRPMPRLFGWGAGGNGAQPQGGWACLTSSLMSLPWRRPGAESCGFAAASTGAMHRRSGQLAEVSQWLDARPSAAPDAAPTGCDEGEACAGTVRQPQRRQRGVRCSAGGQRRFRVAPLRRRLRLAAEWEEVTAADACSPEGAAAAAQPTEVAAAVPPPTAADTAKAAAFAAVYGGDGDEDDDMPGLVKLAGGSDNGAGSDDSSMPSLSPPLPDVDASDDGSELPRLVMAGEGFGDACSDGSSLPGLIDLGRNDFDDDGVPGLLPVNPVNYYDDAAGSDGGDSMPALSD